MAAQAHRAEPTLIEANPAKPYFHLLWEEDLERLRPILESVRDRCAEVIGFWYQLYVLHFGSERTFSEPEFRRLLEPPLRNAMNDLVELDVAGYTREVLALGETLARRGVPLQEVIVSLHLLEEAAFQVFPKDPPPTGRTVMGFDRLSHAHLIILAEAYVRWAHAQTEARIVGLEREAAAVDPSARSIFHGLVGASPVMHALYERIAAAGRTRGTVLVIGESGTGKELVARAIHECSATPHAPFVALNCAALPHDLIESELFGYRRGAFSGANTDYQGLFRAASGGTLFLDEITEMTPDTQSKLLRVLQERKVRPVGATSEVEVDVRLIASTNREVEQTVSSGRLRSDLYYRLQANTIRVAPLRERREDIPLLVAHFIRLFNEKRGDSPPVIGIDQEAMRAMQAYPWPGNVRELSNVIESAFTFGRSSRIMLDDLPQMLTGRRTVTSSSAPVVEARPEKGPLQTFEEVERETIARALEATGGNKVHAARLLAISRKKLYAKIAKYNLS